MADGRPHGVISPATTGSYVWGSTPRTSYTFAALTGPHTISVRFVKGYVPTAQ